MQVRKKTWWGAFGEGLDQRSKFGSICFKVRRTQRRYR